MPRIIIIFCITLLISACTTTKTVIAMNKSTDHFIQLKQDGRVLYEEGSEKPAKYIANKLDNAIFVIEEKQYRNFTKPVAIYICNTVKSFASYCVIKNAAGCVLNERLFLSPKYSQPRKDVLTHELSHLHIEQQLGMYKWHSDYPAWFQEGLATYVSQGQGANKVTIDEAKKVFSKGEYFVPNTSGSLLFPKTAHTYGLKANMFYRQTAMFVQYIHDLDENRFKKFLLSVENGVGLEQSFNSTYDKSINEEWKQFLQQQKA